jgi:serine/threonine-protein kinase RsbW
MIDNVEWTWTTEVKLPSAHRAGRAVLEELKRALKERHWTEHEIFGIRLALEEGLANAIRHGNGSDHSKEVHVVCRLNSQQLFVEIADEGEGFDPQLVPDCTAAENLHRECGRGIMLMRNYMSRVEYLDGGHRLVMEKSRSHPPLSGI